MDIKKIYTPEKVVSLEFAPPLNGKESTGIYNTMEVAKNYNIAAADITLGALKSRRAGSLALVGTIGWKYGIPTILHLPCTRRTYEDIEQAGIELRILKASGLMALQGDDKTFEKNGPKYASDIVKQIAKMNEGKYLHKGDEYQGEHLPENDKEYSDGVKTNFIIAVAAYPQIFPGSTLKQDLWVLKLKQDMGAHYAVTQAIFDPRIFDDWMDQVIGNNITIPIVPAIPVLGTYNSYRIFKKIPGVKFPESYSKIMDNHRERIKPLLSRLEEIKNDPQRKKEKQELLPKIKYIREEKRKAGEGFLLPIVIDYIQTVGKVHLFTMGDSKSTACLFEAIAKEIPSFKK